MILPYIHGVLLSYLLSRFITHQHSPSDACFTSSRTLGGLVDCLEQFTVPKDYYDSYSYENAQPTTLQRKAWLSATSILLDTDDNCTLTIVPPALRGVYSTALFTDADGSSFCVLYESTVAPCTNVYKKGWGFLIVPSSRTSVSRHIHISGPHPFFDGETSAEATQIFKETGAKSLVIPGRIRNAYRAPSGCVAGTKTTTYYMTDPAHNDLEPFVDANIAIWDWQTRHGGCPSSSCAFIQFHGKAETSCVRDTVFLSTGLANHFWYTDGVDRPIKRLKDRLFLAFNSRSSNSTRTVNVSLPSDSRCYLTATKNVVGRYLNLNHSFQGSSDVCVHGADPASVEGLFIHAEQSALARSVASRAAWIQALKETFIEINV